MTRKPGTIAKIASAGVVLTIYGTNVLICKPEHLVVSLVINGLLALCGLAYIIQSD